MARDSLFAWSLLFLFVVAVGAIVMMVRPLVPSSAPATPSLANFAGAAIAADAIPEGYAPPWDVFTGEQFLSFTAEDDHGVVRVQRPGAYVYHTFYVSEGESWVPHEFSNDPWLQDGAEASVPLPQGEAYAIVYTCKPNENAPEGWDCGCTSTTDTVCRKFAIQAFETTQDVTTGCASDDDCTEGVCIDGVCVTTPGCASDDDCTSPPSGYDDKCYTPSCTSGSCSYDTTSKEGKSCTTSSGETGTCQTGSCVPTNIQSLCLTDYTILFQKDDLWTCPHKSEAQDAPAFSNTLFIPELSTMYTADYLGMSSFTFNGQQLQGSKILDFFTSASPVGTSSVASHPCTASYTDGKAPFCIGTDFDCGTSRIETPPLFAGEDEVYVHTHTPYATHDSWLLFGGSGSSFRLLAELFTEYHPLHYENGILPRQGGGVAIFGSGIDGESGYYTAFFKKDGKRYGLLCHNCMGKGTPINGQYSIVDLTNLEAPQIIGEPDSKLVSFLKEHTFNRYPWHLFSRMEGADLVVYDYSNPFSVEEVARAPFPNDRFANQSIVWKDGDDLYAYLPETSQLTKLSPTRVRVEKCLSSGSVRPCYEGELYRYQSGSWVKVMDIPIIEPEGGTIFDSIVIRNGRLYTYGRALTPGEVHQLTSGTHTYNVEIEPDFTLQVFDIATGQRLLKEIINERVGTYPQLSVSDDGLTVYTADSGSVLTGHSTTIQACRISTC